MSKGNSVYGKEYWDQRYNDKRYCYGEEPNSFLLENFKLIRPEGNILCLSEGEGRNATFLSLNGFNVTAVDLSSVAKKKALALAKKNGVQFEYDVADLKDYDLGKLKWDAIISISAHLPSQIRSQLYPSIKESLKDEGIFLLEGYNIQQLEYNSGGPKDPDMMFSKHELEKQFLNFSILLSKDTIRDVVEGAFHTGEASVTQFIARK